MSIENNLHNILSAIKSSKKNSSQNQEVTLVAATKTQPFRLVEEVYSLGVLHIGENRIQEAVTKFKSFSSMPNITRRFIGHLQSNKINKFIDLFDTIDSIDSYKLANKINNKAELLNKPIVGLANLYESMESIVSNRSINLFILLDWRCPINRRVMFGIEENDLNFVTASCILFSPICKTPKE
jgi:hypothetical protein